MNTAPGCRFFNASTAGTVQMMSPMPVNREKMTGRFPVRKMTGKITENTYHNAAAWRFARDNNFMEGSTLVAATHQRKIDGDARHVHNTAVCTRSEERRVG